MAKKSAPISKMKSAAAREKADTAFDKMRGIKEGSKRDNKLDKKNRVPADKK